MIEKHQQTNGIGRGKITINPEYIKRAREITVGGLPVKILSSNPNTGRVLAQFPDGHTEEVKAAPDYFIGGNTSTKELKNNLPIYGETNTAANERADSLDEAHDLTPIFSNLITAGQISTMNEGALDLLNGKYLEGTTKLLSPAMFGSGIGGIAARSGIGGYNLFNKNGVRKTYNLFNLGHYGEGALSLLGDAFNTAMAAEGLGSISNALKGTSGYRNWRLANAINKGVKENAVITAYNRNPVAKDIGNLWDYQSYLDNVFPNSKAKYVLWHGSRSKNLETFNTNMIGSHMPIKNSVGMYLTPERYTAVGYGTRGGVYPVLLNTENPFITNQFLGGISKNGVNVTKISPKVRRTLLANNDAVIAPRRGEIAFFDPDNALILGSNRDMLGFQKFMKSSKPNIEVPNPTKYNISDNITLYRANPTNIKNPSYKGERYGDTSGLYVGKWFTDVPSKPNWYASNMAKGGEEPAYYLVTVPKYWAEQQKASKQISNPRIEFEPEDYIIEDGIQGLRGQLYQGRPGTVQYLQQNFKTPKLSEPSTSLKFFERPQSKISEAERLGVPKGERNQPFKPKLLTEHTQGEEAVKMFKEYGGEPIPEGSINGELLRKYVAEARERYGLIGNNNITDEEIAQALYKHINELNVSINPLTNEPLIGFRGDTQKYTQLKKRMSPEELAKRSGTMDNSLGNLFLGEMPHNYLLGLDRYLVTARPEPHFAFPDKVVLNPNSSATGANYLNLMTEFPSFEELFKQQYFSYPLRLFIGRSGRNLGTIYKVKPEYTNTGVNDINAFMFRGKPRIASDEIQVGNVGRAMSGKPVKFNLMTKETPKIDTTDPEELTYIWKNNKMNILDDAGNETGASRKMMEEHYSNLLKDARKNGEGVLISEKVPVGSTHPFRDEHSHYTYIALPNFNIQEAKHLLPYDLRIPRNWKDKNIYRGLIPLTTGYTLYNIFNQPLQQLQYLKQGGKMNTLLFLKNGSGIHIKPKNRGKFTSGGKNGNKPRIVTTGGAGYVPPIDTENIKTDLKNRLYRTISPYTADYNIPYVASTFLKGKDHDYTIDTNPNDEIIRRAPTIDAIWANYLQIPKKDRRYNAVLGKSKYKPSKGNNNSTYYKLPLVDFEKAELIDRTRDLSLNSNKVDSIFSVYGLGDNTIGRGYDNKGEYVSYFDTFDINPFNGKYRGVNIPLLNKLDDIGLGHPLKIYDRIYLDDYYGVPSSGRGGVYLPEVTVYGKTKKKALGGKMNAVEQFKNGSKIHIKKKNKGKFTDYCGGEVTQECIRKAKASGNPTLVKRATFADNARHFKHKDGGKAFVNGVNVLDSNPKMYKYNKKYKMAQEGAKLTFWLLAGNWIKDNLDSISTIGNGISNLISAKNRLDEINLFALAKQKELKAFKYKTWKDKYLSNLQNQTDRSDIVNAHNAFNLTNINDALQEKLNEINNLIANLLYLNDLQDTGLGDITSGLLGIATNILLGTTKKKKIDNTFSPLANQTMSQIRGKLLDINANFSE